MTLEDDLKSQKEIYNEEERFVLANTDRLQTIGTILFLLYYTLLILVHLSLSLLKSQSLLNIYRISIFIAFLIFPMIASLVERWIVDVLAILYGILFETTRIPSLDNLFLNQSSYSVNAGPPIYDKRQIS